MDNKYYTPSLEDMHVGYEMEVDYGYFTNAEIGTWHPVKLKGVDAAVIEYLSKGFYRTPFLTKEQIEKERWESTSADFTFGRFYKAYDGNSWYDLEYDYSTHELEILVMKADPNGGEPYILTTLYLGQCPSINEFRKLIKWLRI